MLGVHREVDIVIDGEAEGGLLTCLDPHGGHGQDRPLKHPGRDDLPARTRERNQAIAAALDALINEARRDPDDEEPA